MAGAPARLSINGLVYEAPDPTETLANFIRTKTPFTGCKIGCAEGGCGACAVLVSDAPVNNSSSSSPGHRRERTLNACLAPVGVLDGAAVLTSEGLKDSSCSSEGGGENGSVCCAPSKAGVGGGRFHAVHDALAQKHASQCGFCTPGMAIACAAAARRRAKEVKGGGGGASNGHAAAAANGNGSSSSSSSSSSGEDADADADASGDADVSRDLDGNLCRCTGYRSIVDAARSLTPQDVEDVGRKLAPPPELAAAVAARAADASAAGMSLGGGGASGDAAGVSPLSPGSTWRSPRSLDEVRAAVKERGTNSVRFVAGNTGSGVYKQQLCWPPAPGTAVVSLQNVAELRKGVEICEKDGGSVVVSGGTTIAELADWAWSNASSASSCPARSAKTWRELSRALRRVAGAHVRAAATLGGNLALAADPRLALESDVATLLGALGAEAEVLETASGSESRRTLPVLELVSGSNALSPTSLILSVRIPPSASSSSDPIKKKKERFFATRVAARYSHAVASLQLAVSVRQDEGEDSGKKLSDAVVVLAFHRKVSSLSSSSSPGGGGRWLAARLRDAEAALEGASASDLGALAAALRAARAAGLEEAQADDHDREDEEASAPAAQHAEFISGAAEGALAQALAPLFVGGGGGKGGAAADGASASAPPPSSPSSVLLGQCRRLPTPQAAEGSRSWPEPDPTTAPVGAPIEKDRARLQASGEALYTSDYALPASGLHGALVLSTRALARLARVDASRAAASVPGFVKLVTARDVPGSNDAALIGDRIFAPVGGDVEYVGERVGMVVAESEAAARAAAKLVDVVYEESSSKQKPILSIAEAVAKGSFYDVTVDIGPTEKVYGDPDAAFAAAPHVLRGAKVSMPSQAHLYMETQAAVAIPDEGLSSVSIVSGTQCVDMVQSAVCKALGLPAHRVNARARRLGGGFGGKSSRSQVAVACAAVAAFAAGGRPVKLALSRAEDLATIGGRCELEAEYDVAFDAQGRVLALDARAVLLGGAQKDISAFIPLLMLTTVDQNFHLPASRLSAKLARTNLPPRTIMRAPGTLQATLLIEHVMDAVAAATGRDPVDVRELNLLRAAAGGGAEGDAGENVAAAAAAGPRRPCAGELPPGVRDAGDEAARSFDGVVSDEKVVSAFGADLPLDQYTVPRMWALLKKEADVDGRRRAVAQHNAENLFVKRGLAMAACRFVMSVDAKPAIVSIHHDGTVHVTSAGHEMGQGIHTKVLQAACLALSSAQPAGSPPLPMSLFHHADSSTDALPNCGPSWGSTTSEAASEAVRQAALKLADSLRDKFVVDADPGKPGGAKKTLTWQEVVQSVHPSVGFSASKVPLTAYSFYDGTERHEGGQGKTALSYNGYGVAVTEAEVDALTGEARVARCDVMLDAGASLNPALDCGQIEGGYVQGLGLALSEAVRVDPRTGACATSTWQYKIPTADGVPRLLRVHLLPSARHGRGVLSSKAVGEPPLLLASTALCAIQAACDAAREGFAARVGGGGGGSGGAAAAAATPNGTIENRSKEGPALSAPRTLLTAPATPAAVKAAIGPVPLAELVAGGPAGKL